MSRRIEYYLSLASPWAYMGHSTLMEIATRHNADIVCKPVFLGQVFSETGGLPVNKRHPARQRYRFVELQRWRDQHGLDFNIRPKFWPFDVNLVDRFVIAIVNAGQNPDAFLRIAYRSVWEKEQNLADVATLTRLATEAGLTVAPLLEFARSEAAEHIYEQNFRDAVDADVFGSPSYVLDGEVFWGQDRLPMLDHALSTGRLPYTPLV